MEEDNWTMESDACEKVASGWGAACESNGQVCGWGSSKQPPIHRWGHAVTSSSGVQAGEEFLEPNDDTMQEEQCEAGNSSFAEQVSPADYRRQAQEYTRLAVEQLVRSPEYQRKYTRCKMCWCTWWEGDSSPDCPECGGFAMRRPCPVCSGRCGSVWTRDVDMSHSRNEAHWDGECHLPAEERAGFLQELFMEPATTEEVLEGMQQLHTG